MAEPIEVDAVWDAEFVWVQGTCITCGVDAPMGRGTFRVYGRLKSIVKHGSLGAG